VLIISDITLDADGSVHFHARAGQARRTDAFGVLATSVP